MTKLLCDSLGCNAAMLAALLGIVWLSGCTTRPYRIAERAADQEPVAACLASIRDAYPSSCRLTQRVVVRLRSHEYDMVGYLYLRGAGVWSAVALGDMGIELFRLHWTDGVGEVIRQPESMPAAPIREGVIGDIQHLFGQKEAHRSYLVRKPNRDLCLIVELSDRELEEYKFDDVNEGLVSSRSITGGAIVREVSYGTGAAFPGVDHPLPQSITLHNYEWGYSMEIELLDIKLGESH